MSSLLEMYNWNGNYKLKKNLPQKIYKINNLKYPEYFHIFIEDNGHIRYSIIDEKFGYPALANTHNGEYSIKMRAKVVEILNKLESEGYIEKI